MQTKTIFSLLFAVTGINAAPGISRRQDAVPLQIYDSAGCNNGPTPVTTVFLPTDGSCFGFSPIVSANTDSGLVNTGDLPAGCKITVFSDSTCSSVNTITVTQAGQCFTFGAGKFLSSARTSGTC